MAVMIVAKIASRAAPKVRSLLVMMGLLRTGCTATCVTVAFSLGVHADARNDALPSPGHANAWSPGCFEFISSGLVLLWPCLQCRLILSAESAPVLVGLAAKPHPMRSPPTAEPSTGAFRGSTPAATERPL